ncbi:MAG: thiamine diphosphokinase [Patescibacteria group bacterium]
MKRAIVFVNGNLSDFSQAKNIIKKTDCLIASDGGVKHILKLGLIPNIVIGDFDSTPKNMRSAPTLITYPTEKDATDFELATDYCLEKKFQEIIIFGFLGDRIDHLLANIFLLTKIQTENKSIKIKIIEGKKEIFILNKEIVINGQIGDEVSIVPVSEKLEKVATDGLYYRLIDDTLLFGSTRGISNVMNKNTAKITVTDGVALITHLRK